MNHIAMSDGLFGALAMRKSRHVYTDILLHNQPIADPCLAGYDSNDQYMHVGDLVSGMNRDAHTNDKRPKSQIRSG